MCYNRKIAKSSINLENFIYTFKAKFTRPQKSFPHKISGFSIKKPVEAGSLYSKVNCSSSQFKSTLNCLMNCNGFMSSCEVSFLSSE